MVDAARVSESIFTQSPGQRAASGAESVSIHAADEAALAAYARFCANADYAAPQHPHFVGAWARQPGRDLIVATLRRGGQPVFMLPLEITRSGLFTIARLPGGRHANASFAPVARHAADIGTDELAELFDNLRHARPDVDVLLLERLERLRHGRANPLALVSSGESPNPALAVDLRDGFEAVLARTSGKRKRKKYRSQARKFEAAGGYRLIGARDTETVERLLAAFFDMKAARFRRMGIADVFADPDIRASWRRLFLYALADPAWPFRLEALEVGGVLRAVTGSSVSGDRITCEFGAIGEDELSNTSPGDFLFFEHIRTACEAGFATYDFGVGDEPYKRFWCDIETRHFDADIALNAKGRLLALSRRGTSAAKRQIKGNPALWAMAKRLRRFVSGEAEQPAKRADEDGS